MDPNPFIDGRTRGLEEVGRLLVGAAELAEGALGIVGLVEGRTSALAHGDVLLLF
jgi:hypothetical protein